MAFLKSHRHQFLRGSLVSPLLAALIATFLVTASVAFAQTEVPDAPTAVAVYTIESRKLEVRWSTSDAASTTSFKIQWKSGAEEYDSSRELSSDPATSIVSEQTTSAGDRYVDIITGLTDGTEYTVRVIATNSSGDSDPSAEATGTPKSTPGSTASQAREFWENEVVKIFEGSHPWLRETWTYITAKNVAVLLPEGQGSNARVFCSSIPSGESNLRECSATDVTAGRSDPDIIYLITHELAHVYTLATGISSSPGPLGVAHLYIHDLAYPVSFREPLCASIELYADALALLTLGDGFSSSRPYWSQCSVTRGNETATEQALAVLRSATTGQMPSWFTDTYNDSDGNPDLERFWADLKEIWASTNNEGGYRATAIYQLRDSFGGYCDNRKATDSAFGSGITRNPWRDGGCVPEEPLNLVATTAGIGTVTLSWQEPPYDGGSTIEGFKVQWKSGTQEYDSSRQATVPYINDLQHTISGLTGDVSHTFRVLAYNHNGDGAAAETTATPAVTDTTAPALLLARLDYAWVRLIWNEALDESSLPPSTAVAVTVNGLSRSGNIQSIRGNVVTFGLEGVTSAVDSLTVSYTAPTGSGAMPLRDSGGNNAADFSAQSVRNDKIQVAITSDPGPDKTYSYSSGNGKEDVVEVTVTFSEPVIVSGVPEIELEVGSNKRRAVYHSGSGTSSLVFRYPVTEGETDSDGIYIRSRGSQHSQLIGMGLVRYASTNAIAIAPARLERSIQSDHLVDGVSPTLVSADIVAGGTDLTLRWDKALDEDSATGSSLFTVENTNDNSSLDITATSIQGQVVTLALSSAVSATDQLTVSYSDPFEFTPEHLLMQVNHKPLKDTVGNVAKEATSSVSITLNANSPPEFPTTEDGARSVDENTPANRNIGAAVTATDADRDRRTYSLSGTDAEFFDVVANSGQLRTKDALDHESRDSYSFTISVHDGKDAHGNADTTIDDTISVTVTVGDVDEGPTVTGEADPSVDENTETFSRTYSASDPEGAASTYTWSLSGTDRGDFDIDRNTGELTFKNTPDYERPADSGGNNEYLVTVVATDQDNLRGMLEVTVTVNDVNEAPTVTGNQTLSFPENSTRSVATYRGTDPERVVSTFTWNISGTDSRDFSIDRNTGELTFSNAPDFENPTDADRDNEYLITVEAQDDGFNTGTLDVTVTVTDECTSAGEPPCAPRRPGVSSASDTSLRVTWSTPSTPSGTSITGYDLQYRESDNGNSWIPQSVTGTDRSHTIENLIKGTSYEVQVGAQNDSSGYGEWSESGTGTPGSSGGGGGTPPPTGPSFTDGASTSRSVAVPAPSGADVGDPVVASHPANLDITYSLIASVPVLFTVDEMTGQIRLVQGVSLVSGQTYRVTVKATDSTDMEAYIDVVVDVEPHQYDLNRNGTFEKEEVIEAINDYLFGTGDDQITKAEVIEIIGLYLFG